LTHRETPLSPQAENLLRVAASLESNSEHPLGRAIVELARDRKLELDPIATFEAVPGGGVRGRISGATRAAGFMPAEHTARLFSSGTSPAAGVSNTEERASDSVLAGNERFLLDAGFSPLPMAAEKDRLEAEGKTVVWVALGTQVLGLLALADQVKPNAAQAVSDLRRLGLDAYLITGDAPRPAAAIAEQLSIPGDRVLAGVMPQAKAAKVRELQAAGHRVAMVGDGINDAPALVQADLGIALGSGTDIAIESGHIVLISGDLSGLVRALRLSRVALRVIRQNLFWAFFYNVAAIPLAALGILHPIVAAVAMAASSVSVVTNSLLLKRRSLA
jgi:Cu+-exporting ATPase